MERFPIGRSVQGRPIDAFVLGPSNASLRALVLAGQHGDERPAVRALRQLAQGGWLPAGTAVALIPALNPDGRAQRRRSNAEGIDLNRDHQALHAPETRALHRFVRQWRPHLAIDAHCYPPRRKALLQRGLVNAYDLLVDWPTNPAAQFDVSWSDLLARLQQRLGRSGRRCERYFLLTPSSRLRHSTADVVDARNALAVRYGLPVVLLEGRSASRRDKRPYADPAEGLRLAVEESIHWAAELGAAALAPRVSSSVALRSRYRNRRSGPALVFERISDGGLTRAFPAKKYSPELRVLQTRRTPDAYAVPLSNGPLLEWLERHGLRALAAAPHRSREVEILTPHDLQPTRRSLRAPRRLHLNSRHAIQTLDGYAIFAARGPAANWLAVALEPESKYGVHRRPELGLRLEPGLDYAVRRISSQSPEPSGSRQTADAAHATVPDASTVEASNPANRR